jgi:hypothetical protein
VCVCEKENEGEKVCCIIYRRGANERFGEKGRAQKLIVGGEFGNYVKVSARECSRPKLLGLVKLCECIQDCI